MRREPNRNGTAGHDQQRADQQHQLVLEHVRGESLDRPRIKGWKDCNHKSRPTDREGRRAARYSYRHLASQKSMIAW
jgi:hypothetical protein